MSGVVKLHNFRQRSQPVSIPLRGLEGVPGLPGASKDEAGLTRKLETSHVGGATQNKFIVPDSIKSL